MVQDYFGSHIHSDYSNIRGLDSINKIEKIIDYAISIGMSGIAITDHECLSSHVRALQYIEKLKKNNAEAGNNIANFKLALGNEIYLVRNGLNKDNYIKDSDKYYHFILIAKDKIGHDQLRQLSSRAWSRSFRQYVERVPTYYSDIEEIIEKDPGHIIATTACLGGYLPNLFLKSQEEKDMKNSLEVDREIEKFLTWCKRVFDKDFYIELQPSFNQDQRDYNKFAYDIGIQYNIPSIIATDAHYLKKDDRKVHKAYLNAGDNDREVDAFYASTFIMSAEEIHSYMTLDFSPNEIDLMLENTKRIKNSCCDYSLYHQPIVPKSAIPNNISIPTIDNIELYPYVKQFKDSDDLIDNYLLLLIYQGIELKIPKSEQVNIWNRVNKELKELHELSINSGDNMSAYLLIVKEIIDLIWDEGDSLVGPSRGSALGFVINYLIGVTQINPVDREIPLPYWRFINGQRVSLPDIDIDTQGLKRERIITAIKRKYGHDKVALVATFRTEKTKSAIITTARGLGIDTDEAQYISSMVPIERGFAWSFSDCYHGNSNKGRAPIKAFIKAIDEAHPMFYQMVQHIEGLVCGRSSHASGILITNSVLTEYNAIMTAPNGVFITQYDLDDSEYMGGIKFDLLSIDALDRIRVSMDLLIEYNFITKQNSLRDTYNKYFHPDVIKYDDLDLWNKAHKGEVLSLFQFETPVGGDAIRRTKPTSLIDLAIINSLMRLQAPEGMDMPIDTYIKYMDNIELWYRDMENAQLTKQEIEILEKHLLPLKGVADSQESMMLLVMDPNISNYTLGEADGLRKVVGKKLMDKIPESREFFFKKGYENNASEHLLTYVWDVLIKRQLGYSFSSLHTYAYSTIAVIELNIYHYYPALFWNTANLIVDSAGNEDEEIEDLIEPVPGYVIEDENENSVDSEDDYIETNIINSGERTKKKVRNMDYGKVSTAIGKIQQYGVKISPPDINQSKYSFIPDLNNNAILFGIKGITRIGEDLVKTIIENRPYSSISDFLSKVKVTKPQMVNLIKSGAFDNLRNRSRLEIMEEYIDSISDKKKKLTLQNMPMLIRYNLIPKELDFYRRLFNFNRYLKQFKSDDGLSYILDDKAANFINLNYSEYDLIEYDGSIIYIYQKNWDKVYKKEISPMRDYLKTDSTILDTLNQTLYSEVWDKYCQGSISKWEMDSISFYYNDHELSSINNDQYGIVDFNNLPEDPVPTHMMNFGKRQIPIYKLQRIAGTILNKDKTKHILTILTTSGVVQVKVYQNQFSKYDKQLSIKDNNGVKKVVEKSWFARGNKIIVTGIRRGDSFIPKIYKSTKPHSPFLLITSISDDGSIEYRDNREEPINDWSD